MEIGSSEAGRIRDGEAGDEGYSLAKKFRLKAGECLRVFENCSYVVPAVDLRG